MDDKAWTIQEAARYLQVPVSTLYVLAREGRVPGRKVGRAWRFDRESLRAWLRGGRHSHGSRRGVERAASGSRKKPK